MQANHGPASRVVPGWVQRSHLQRGTQRRRAVAKGNILIVDDHELDRRLSTLDLEDAGFTVYEAGDVTDALNLLSQRSFDAIVLDIVMPGTDGLTFLRGLKSS